MSRYHVFRQHDGLGYGVLRQDSPGSASAVVMHANLSRDEADGLCLKYRREVAPSEHPPVCPRCHNDIDPDTCHCGTDRDHHHSFEYHGHGFVPMGCDCLREDEDS